MIFVMTGSTKLELEKILPRDKM